MPNVLTDEQALKFKMSKDVRKKFTDAFKKLKKEVDNISPKLEDIATRITNDKNLDKLLDDEKFMSEIDNYDAKNRLKAGPMYENYNNLNPKAKVKFLKINSKINLSGAPLNIEEQKLGYREMFQKSYGKGR